MSKIQKCHLETYWANKEVFTRPKSQNVVWKTYWANKENIFVLWAQGAWGPQGPYIFNKCIYIFVLIFFI